MARGPVGRSVRLDFAGGCPDGDGERAEAVRFWPVGDVAGIA